MIGRFLIIFLKKSEAIVSPNYQCHPENVLDSLLKLVLYSDILTDVAGILCFVPSTCSTLFIFSDLGRFKRIRVLSTLALVFFLSARRDVVLSLSRPRDLRLAAFPYCSVPQGRFDRHFTLALTLFIKGRTP
jgi:hypothetical protein